MAKNEVIGGDYKGYQIGSGWGGNVYLRSSPFSKPLDLTKENIKKVEIVTEENKKKVLGTLGGGIAGGLLLGPIGLFAGLLAGGNKKEVCFMCYLKDGKKFMGVTESKTFQRLMALTA